MEKSNNELLNLIARRAFDFFYNETHPKTGLTKDRANNFKEDDYTICSIASTGYALAALPIGVERKWITREQGYRRAMLALHYLLEHEHKHGWFYHFVHWETGKRLWNCELSSIDTALLIMGVLVAGQYFNTREIKTLANRLYDRLDFQWMLTDGGAKPDERTIGHGWKPETGFLRNRWHSYCEHIFLYLLAMGSTIFPIAKECWDAWERPHVTYKGYEMLTGGPLFLHQMSHVYIDLRGKRDRLGYHYSVSSRNATLAQKQFCIDHRDKFKTYSANTWGLTASDGPDGYRAYGAPGKMTEHDGTVAPTAAITSIIFTPNESITAAKAFHGQYQDKLWGRYGFSNAYNLQRNWWGQDVIGIDLGMMLLALENHRTGFIWKLCSQIAPIKQGLQKAGFQTVQESETESPLKKTRE